MDIVHRIRFYLKMEMRTKAYILKNWWKKTVLHQANDELLAEDFSAVDNFSHDEKEEIQRTVAEWDQEAEAKRPILDPRRTMLIHSMPEEHACNALTAAAYRLKLLAAVKWAQKRGITTFMADYYTPLGLLALETLVDLREEGTDFQIYAVRSTYFRQRRTYRAVKETPAEMAFLPVRADYCYQETLEDMLHYVLPMAWTRCSEKGIWIAKERIPAYLLEAWEI